MNSSPGDGGISDKTIAMLRETPGFSGYNPQGPAPTTVAKVETSTTGVTTGTGIYGYPLFKPALQLYSYFTYFVEKLGRHTQGEGGVAAHWVAVDGIMSAGWDMGIAEAATGTAGVNQTHNESASFKSLGTLGEVTFEAVSAAQSFDDAKAMETLHTLQRLRMGEEAMDIGGVTTGIIKPTTLTFADTAAASAGTLSVGTTYYYAVSAFTLMGSGVLIGNTQVTGRATSGSVDTTYETDARTGSHATTGSSLGSTATVVNWPAVPGAVGYNVFVGTSSTVYFWKTVYTNTCTVTNATPTSSNVPNTATTGNKTAIATAYDGMLYQAANWTNPAGITLPSGATYSNFVDMAGAGFTASGFGSVTEIDTALGSLFQALRVAPDCLALSPQEAINLRNKILTQTAGGSASGAPGSFRVILNDKADQLQGGSVFASYLNPYMPQQIIDVVVHPFLPPGTAMLMTNKLPAYYPNANLPGGTTWSKELRRDYYGVDYAVAVGSGRVYPFGNYMEGVMAGFFPGGTVVFSGIANS